MAINFEGIYRVEGVFYPHPKNPNLWIYHPDRIPWRDVYEPAGLKRTGQLYHDLKKWLVNPDSILRALHAPNMNNSSSYNHLFTMDTRLNNYPRPIVSALAWHMMHQVTGVYPDLVKHQLSGNDYYSWLGYCEPKTATYIAAISFRIMSGCKNYELDCYKQLGKNNDVFYKQLMKERTTDPTKASIPTPLDLGLYDWEHVLKREEPYFRETVTDKEERQKNVDKYLQEIADTVEAEGYFGDLARFLMNYRVPSSRGGSGWAQSRR
jgi:hypothetical protein